MGHFLKEWVFWPNTRLLETEFSGDLKKIYILKDVTRGDSYNQASLGNNHRSINTEGNLKLDNLVCKIQSSYILALKK
jgi:hypothetical protein